MILNMVYKVAIAMKEESQ